MSNIQSASYAGDIETYQIYGGQAVSIELQHGDSVEIVDVEGDQQCNLLAFDSKGSMINNSLEWNSKPSSASTEIVSADCSDMLKAILSHNKIDTSKLSGIELFKDKSRADSRQFFCY